MIFVRRGTRSSGGAELVSGCASSSRASRSRPLADSEDEEDECESSKLRFSSMLMACLSEAESYCGIACPSRLDCGTVASDDEDLSGSVVFILATSWCSDMF